MKVVGYRESKIKTTLNDVFNEEEKQKVIEILKKFRETEVGKKIEMVMKVGTKEEDFAFDTTLQFKGFWDKTAWLRGSADLFFLNYDEKIIDVNHISDIPDDYELVNIIEE